MRSLRSVLAVAVALALVPGTFWRSEIKPIDPTAPVLFEAIAADSEGVAAGPLRFAGAWHLTSANRGFGGYSALVVRPDGSLLAGSDAGGLLSIADPGSPGMDAHVVDITANEHADKRDADLEALTIDPASSKLWAAYEGSNAVESYTPSLARIARSQPPLMRRWRANGGPEAFERLADGRFIALAEVQRYGDSGGNAGVLFASDPAAGDATGENGQGIVFAAPAGFRPVDMAQLPDGRILVLLRRIASLLPLRFAGAIAVMNPADLAAREVWRPRAVLALPAAMPSDNFEGLAVARGPGPDGTIALWLVSDDNFSAFQRTLLVRLIWQERQKARGPSARP